MRKKLSLLCWLAVLAAALAVGAATGQASDEPQPKAFFPESTWRFTPVMEGSEVIHDFIVKNQGSAPLNILGVKTS